ncbi:MAG: rhomboid family intramembrane serine protease [Myxococcota bacterium]
MFFPIGDTPNPRNYTAWVNWALIAINVLVYLIFSLPMSMGTVDPNDPALQAYLRALQGALPAGVSIDEVLGSVTPYDLFVFEHGYQPGAPQLTDLFSAMFLHSGFGHLGGNMLFLWIYGDNVEHRLGRLPYLGVYLLTGIVATVSFAAFAGDSMIPLIGASGAISGVLGLYFVFFRRNRVKVFVFLFPIVFNTFLIPARIVLGLYVVIDNLLPILTSGGGGSGVAYGAHLGGFFAGVLIALLVNRLAPEAARYRRRSEEPVVDFDRRQSEDKALNALRDAIEQGEQRAAIGALQNVEASELGRLSGRHLGRLAGWIADFGEEDVGVWLFSQALRAHRRNPTASAGLHLGLGLLRLAQGQDSTAYQHLMAATEADPSGETGELAARAIERVNLYRRSP